MTFTHPWVLLLLAVPVVLAWTAIARAPGLVSPADHARHRERPWLVRVLGFFDLVPLALLAVAILVLAGPQTLQQPKRERSLTNIQICLDVSGSMSGRNYQLASKAVEVRACTHTRKSAGAQSSRPYVALTPASRVSHTIAPTVRKSLPAD